MSPAVTCYHFSVLSSSHHRTLLMSSQQDQAVTDADAATSSTAKKTRLDFPQEQAVAFDALVGRLSEQIKDWRDHSVNWHGFIGMNCYLLLVLSRSQQPHEWFLVIIGDYWNTTPACNAVVPALLFEKVSQVTHRLRNGKRKDKKNKERNDMKHVQLVDAFLKEKANV